MNYKLVNFFFAILRQRICKAFVSHANLRDADLMLADLRDANLRDADLSGADISGANLRDADLSGADLSGAYLRGTDLGGAILSEAKLSRSKLLAAKLMCANLSGANLSGADFSFANLNHANLSDAILSDAILSDANLFRLNALRANFYQSHMTGACIHDWHINSETNFEGVQCDYIYRGYDDYQREKRDRLPINSDQNFKAGEFEEWIKVQAEARQTIDLTFTDGIDWQAFFQSLKGVREQYPQSAVGLQAIEKKGSAFVIRLETAPEAEQGAIESTQKELYETELKLSEAQGQVIAYRNVIESMVIKMAEDNKVTQNFNAPAGNVTGTNEGEMKAVQHNYACELRQTPAESAKEIQDLLLQLQQSNPTDIQSLVEQRVKSDPTLRQRIKNALKEGGLETMKVIFPLTGIAIETVRGWIEAERD